MKTVARLSAVFALLVVALLGLRPASAAAQTGPYPLSIDAGHRATTGPIFARDERIVFWHNLPNGSAGFFFADSEEVVYARDDGSIDVTFSNDHRNLPAAAVSVVAHGLSSNLSVAYIVPVK